MEFRRPHHRAIARALKSFDAELFAKAECYFGGGTAIALTCNEFRESVYIDFLCASTEGYRALTTAVWENGLSGLFLPEPALQAGIQELRELRRQRDKMTAIIGVEAEGEVVATKLEIVREARIDLTGAMHPGLGIPTLDLDCMYAEKLLANTDRGNDRATMSRDIIDLSVLQLHHGLIPDAAWAAVDEAYGKPAREAYAASVARIRDRSWLLACAEKMSIEHDLVEEILQLHGGSFPPPPSPFDD